jgi:hypothetical protein
MLEAECRTPVRPIQDSDRGLFRLDFDVRHRDPSTMTVLAVEEVADARMEKMTPLQESIDPDALDAIFGPRPDGTSRTDLSVTFQFEGYEVTVESDGTIILDRV